jgi:hypothetical protein
LLERSQIVRHVWIFRRQRFDIADFDVDFLYARLFCARAEEPAPSFEFEHGTSNVQYRMGSWTSNLKFQIAKIEQA